MSLAAQVTVKTVKFPNCMGVKGFKIPDMKFDSYKTMVKTPEAVASFFGEVAQNFKLEGKENERLFQFLTRTVSVDGKPFSQAKHLVALEDQSGNWDLPELPQPVQQSLATNALEIHKLDQGYDVPSFIVGFESMARDLQGKGIELDYSTEVQPPKDYSSVSFELGR
jgi:hypothetical protein